MSRLVVATDPTEVDVTGAVVVVAGVGLARRARVRGGLPVVARPDALPVRAGGVDVVRADGAFAYSDPPTAAHVMAELFRVRSTEGAVVASAQVDPGPPVAGRPVSAEELARMGGGEPETETFHDRRCRKDWHRLRWGGVEG